MNPQSLGVLTHGEFLELFEGYKWREKREREQMATLASWVTFPHLKRPMEPSKFLKGSEEKPKKKTTPLQAKKIVNDLEKLLGVR